MVYASFSLRKKNLFVFKEAEESGSLTTDVVRDRASVEIEDPRMWDGDANIDEEERW